VGTAGYSGDRVRRSVEESLERLGLDQLPLVHLHDPEKISFEEAVAGGPIDLELKYLAMDVFDVVISHNRYTPEVQTAEPLMEDARRRGIAFINAALFGGGLLVKGPDATANYCYRRPARNCWAVSGRYRTFAASTRCRLLPRRSSSPPAISASRQPSGWRSRDG